MCVQKRDIIPAFLDFSNRFWLDWLFLFFVFRDLKSVYLFLSFRLLKIIYIKFCLYAFSFMSCAFFCFVWI